MTKFATLVPLTAEQRDRIAKLRKLGWTAKPIVGQVFRNAKPHELFDLEATVADAIGADHPGLPSRMSQAERVAFGKEKAEEAREMKANRDAVGACRKRAAAALDTVADVASGALREKAAEMRRKSPSPYANVVKRRRTAR